MRAELPWERPLGARPGPEGSTEFRVWAPRAESLALRLGGRELALEDAGHGVFETGAETSGDQDYAFLVNGQELPDPCTRWQPAGLRGPSRVLDPASFEWSDSGFEPGPLADQVLYELHVGTFSAEGTFDGATAHLRELAETGITAIELMPVAEFPGARGWGYDGVYLSAAHSAYGGPAGLARLVNAAHAEGLAVLLDVVYNHLGASGVKAMEAFGHYFTDKYETPWGRAINFDDAYSDPVREWVLQSAEAWVRDFHVDGLRLDAIHAIVDSSPEHLVAAVARRVHAARPGAFVIAESGLNDPRVMRPADRGGHACDAAWADDFHHALRVLLTDDREGYYAEFGQVGQLAKAFHRPYVHDGQYSSFRKRRFGAPAGDVPPERFVIFDQNHDQVGNRAYGDRLPLEARPLAAFCTLLSPFTPMLFMGEEYGERAPFQFFSDHIDEEIATATREGRRREFAAFAQFGEEIPDPQSPRTFEASKLTRERDPELAALYRRLLAARRDIPDGDVAGMQCEEDARWLRVLRKPGFELVCNFSRARQAVPCGRGRVVLATHGDPRPGENGIELEPLAGALIAS
jgi:maltooligosyltrehalose trehalohydrolase